VRRREFIAGLGCAAAWPLAVWAQQQPAVPVVGYITLGLGGVQAFLKGLAEAGYVEGRNVAIEYDSVGSNNERLPAVLSDLIGPRPRRRGDRMKRREFIAGFGGAATRPILAERTPIAPQGLKLHRPLITPHSFRDRILVPIYAQGCSVIILFCPSSAKWPIGVASSR
jgi:hypothetical protein